jgi:DNA-binding protein HU-beta
MIAEIEGGFITMTKAELIAAVAAKTDFSKKDVDVLVNSVLDTIGEELAAGGKVQLVGFGTFEVRERAAREGKNPATGEVIQIAASKAPAFKAGKALKDLLK